MLKSVHNTCSDLNIIQGGELIYYIHYIYIYIYILYILYSEDLVGDSISQTSENLVSDSISQKSKIW